MQDALVARIQKIFRFFNFEKILQQLHKAPKVPRSAFMYVWGIRGNGADHRYRYTKVHGRRRNPSLYLIKEPWREESYRKIFRTKPRGLLPPHLRALPASGSCQGSATASRRIRRGLDTSLPPRPFLRYVGNGEVCKPAITVRGYDRGLAQYRDRRFCQPRPPVWELNAVLRFESLGCQ